MDYGFIREIRYQLTEKSYRNIVLEAWERERAGSGATLPALGGKAILS